MNLRDQRFGRFTPLQCLPDSDGDDDNIDSEMTANPPVKKIKIPSICVLQKTCENVHSMLSDLEINDYFIKKMSIGIKINCAISDDHAKICSKLKTLNWQFFTHDLPAARSFKVVLFGLEEIPIEQLKNELITIGLKCQNVKMIKKQYKQYTDIFYIVFLESGTIKLSELKKNVRSLFKTQVKWDFARRQKQKFTQCLNCQMFGHGEKNCHIKTHCAICSEPHETSKCKSNNIKCANCNETHPSTDPSCPSRKNFFEIREKLSSRNRKQITVTTARRSNQTYVPTVSDFPALPPRRRGANIIAPEPTQVNVNPDHRNVWSINNNNNNFNNNINNNAGPEMINDLFSMEEINALTAEMLTLLGKCKNKADQFNTIAQLAIKYLYKAK